MRTPVRQRAMITCTYLVYPSSAPIPAGTPLAGQRSPQLLRPQSLTPLPALPCGSDGRAEALCLGGHVNRAVLDTVKLDGLVGTAANRFPSALRLSSRWTPQ